MLILLSPTQTLIRTDFSIQHPAPPVGSSQAKQRADVAMVARGMADSRAKAQAMLMAGEMLMNDKPLTKAGTTVRPDDVLRHKASAGSEETRWVSRSAQKLAHAMVHFAIDVSGHTCLDVGASTGGFTEVLLEHGAEKVFAIDVGHSQLAWKIRSDARVVVRERLNARYLTPQDLAHAPISVMVCDVSFISVALLLPAVTACLTRPASAVVLCKPQFELGKASVPPHGVVSDPELHAQAIDMVSASLRDNGWQVLGTCPSSLTGRKGNREFLIHAHLPTKED